MQILLRTWGEEQYVWKTAKYNGTKFVVGNNEVYYPSVVSVVNDNRKNHVVCQACGVFLKNDLKILEAHKNRHAEPDACLKCGYLRINSNTEIGSKIIMKKDGTYIRKREEKVGLGCKYRQYWGTLEIGSAEAKRNCALRACADAQFVPFKDVFMEYPGIFDYMAMVDRIIDVGYKQRRILTNYTSYQLKGRNKIIAFVNKLGIVDYFNVSYHEEEYRVFYSKRYDKIFISDGYNYIPFEDTVYNVPTKTKEYIKRKIAELYN